MRCGRKGHIGAEGNSIHGARRVLGFDVARQGAVYIVGEDASGSRSCLEELDFDPAAEIEVDRTVQKSSSKRNWRLESLDDRDACPEVDSRAHVVTEDPPSTMRAWISTGWLLATLPRELLDYLMRLRHPEGAQYIFSSSNGGHGHQQVVPATTRQMPGCSHT